MTTAISTMSVDGTVAVTTTIPAATLPAVTTTTTTSAATTVVTTTPDFITLSGNITPAGVDSEGDPTLLITLVTVTPALVIVISILVVCLYYYKCHRYAGIIVPEGKHAKNRPVSALKADDIKNLFTRPKPQTHETHMTIYENEIRESFKTKTANHKTNGTIYSGNGKHNMKPPAVNTLYDCQKDEDKAVENMFAIKDSSGYFKDQDNVIEKCDTHDECQKYLDKKKEKHVMDSDNKHQMLDEPTVTDARVVLNIENKGQHKNGQIQVTFKENENHEPSETKVTNKHASTELRSLPNPKHNGAAEVETTHVKADLIKQTALAKPGVKRKRRSFPRGLESTNKQTPESKNTTGTHAERLTPIKGIENNLKLEHSDSFEETLMNMRRVRKIYREEIVLNTNFDSRTYITKPPASKRTPKCELLRQMTI